MKYFRSVVIISLFFPLLVYSLQSDYKQIASNHFQKLGIHGQELYLEQETDKYLLFISKFTFNDKEHPCHTGVTIDKKSGMVVLLKNDQSIDLDFPYSDTFVIAEKLIYKFCAD